jgi:peptide subunit release factor RF-3
MSHKLSRWLEGAKGEDLRGLGTDVLVVTDRGGREVVLFTSEWALQYAERENPGVRFLTER